MNDETNQTPADTETKAPVPLSEEHAAALDLAASAQTPEDKAAADALVQEAVDHAQSDAGESNAAAEPESEPEPESLTDEARAILTAIEDEVESLLHSPIALVAWVKSKVAEAKAKL